MHLNSWSSCSLLSYSPTLRLAPPPPTLLLPAILSSRPATLCHSPRLPVTTRASIAPDRSQSTSSPPRTMPPPYQISRTIRFECLSSGFRRHPPIRPHPPPSHALMSPPNNSLCQPPRFVVWFHHIEFYSLLSSRVLNWGLRAMLSRRPPMWTRNSSWRRVRRLSERLRFLRRLRQCPSTRYPRPARTVFVPSSLTHAHTVQSC